MMKYIKKNWKFLLFVLIGGLIGGYFVGLWSFDSLSEEMLKQLQNQNVTREMFALSTMYQYGILYGVILAVIGIVISKKTNLWKEFKIDLKAIITTTIITFIGGLVLFPGDKLIFGTFNNWVNETYNTAPGLSKIIGGLLVGGIIEEVMLRLFLMSLLSLIIYKLFYKKSKEIPVKVYIIANIISAILFAAGHLPSTALMTTLTPLLIIRCFVLNSGYGLCFGYLYRKYGIGYAMVSHGLCHLIADILMVLFI